VAATPDHPRGSDFFSDPCIDGLRRAQVLGFRLQHEPLKEWTKKELDGYHHTDDLPPYRYMGRGQVPVKGEIFSGGVLARNVPMAPSDLDGLGPANSEMVKKHLFETLLIRPISEYELLLATGNHEFPMPWTGDEVRIVAMIWPGPDQCRSDDPGQRARELDRPGAQPDPYVQPGDRTTRPGRW
jgi:hypothetical protein